MPCAAKDAVPGLLREATARQIVARSARSWFEASDLRPCWRRDVPLEPDLKVVEQYQHVVIQFVFAKRRSE